MNLADIENILKDVRCRDYTFKLGVLGDGFYVQVTYVEPDVHTGVDDDQSGRKWYISSHAVKSEVVQTCLKAVLTSMEHRAREHFLYKGVALYGPHLNAEKLFEFVQKASSHETRGDKYVLWNDPDPT